MTKYCNIYYIFNMNSLLSRTISFLQQNNIAFTVRYHEISDDIMQHTLAKVFNEHEITFNIPYRLIATFMQQYKYRTIVPSFRYISQDVTDYDLQVTDNLIDNVLNQYLAKRNYFLNLNSTYFQNNKRIILDDNQAMQYQSQQLDELKYTLDSIQLIDSL